MSNLRQKIRDAVFPPNNGMQNTGGIGIFGTGEFMVTGNFEGAVERLEALVVKEIKDSEKKRTPLSILDLSARANNYLVNHGINTIEKLENISLSYLMSIPGIGKSTYNEIIAKAHKYE